MSYAAVRPLKCLRIIRSEGAQHLFEAAAHVVPRMLEVRALEVACDVLQMINQYNQFITQANISLLPPTSLLWGWGWAHTWHGCPGVSCQNLGFGTIGGGYQHGTRDHIYLYTQYNNHQ